MSSILGLQWLKRSFFLVPTIDVRIQNRAVGRTFLRDSQKSHDQ